MLQNASIKTKLGAILLLPLLCLACSPACGWPTT